MLALVNCIRSIEKNRKFRYNDCCLVLLQRLVLLQSLVAMTIAFALSATNSPVTISCTLLSLNSLTLDYIGLLVSFSVSSTNITWMLENALFISQFCISISSSSSRAVYCNKSIH